MSSRAERALSRAAGDRQVQLAASAAAAGVAAVTGKVVLDHLRQDGDSGPSRAYRLKSGEKLPDGLVRIASGRIESALENLSAAGGRHTAEAVHEARKDLKKIRSLLRLVRASAGEELYRAENDRYRQAGRSLAGARDAEVMLETLAALEERCGDELEDAVAGFRGHLERWRDEAEPDTEAATALIAQGRASVEDWAARNGGWSRLEPGLKRSYRRGRRLMERTQASPTDENVHEWRKRTKDLWYQLRILRDAWPGPIGEVADESHDLADLLGDHHDLAVLRTEAENRRGCFSTAKDRKRLTDAIEVRQEELVGPALDLGHRLYAEKPKVFVRRIGSYWSAWRG